MVTKPELAAPAILQRRLRAGFQHAADILALLHLKGIVGPPEDAKPRAVLMRPDELDQALARLHEDSDPERALSRRA